MIVTWSFGGAGVWGVIAPPVESGCDSRVRHAGGRGARVLDWLGVMEGAASRSPRGSGSGVGLLRYAPPSPVAVCSDREFCCRQREGSEQPSLLSTELAP